jgi:hypothetical protein
MKTNQLISYKTEGAVCSELGTKRTNALCEQTVEFLGPFAKIAKSEH